MKTKTTLRCSYLLLLSIIFTKSIFAGGEIFTAGARQAGMGRTSVSITDFWSVQNNQAGIALLDRIGVGLYYQNQFQLSQLSQKAIAVVVPSKIGVLGLSFTHFGYELYNDIKIGLAYARSFGPYFRIGLQLDYLRTSLGENYGSKSNVTFELGVQSNLTNNLTIGAWVFNPIQVKLADYADEYIPVIFKLGMGWNIDNGLLVNIEAEKNTAFQAILLRAGVEYALKEKFFFRGGFSTAQEIFSMGFGMQFKILRIDLSAIMHNTLGFSSQGSLILQF